VVRTVSEAGAAKYTFYGTFGEKLK